MVAGLKDKTSAGVLDCISVNGKFEACADALIKIKGERFIATCGHPPEKSPDGISVKFIFGSSLKDNEVSKVFYKDFLPKALAEGKFVAMPNPHVVGKRLECVQEAFEVQKNGVSAK